MKKWNLTLIIKLCFNDCKSKLLLSSLFIIFRTFKLKLTAKKLAFLLKWTCWTRLFCHVHKILLSKENNWGWRKKANFQTSEPSEWNPNATLLVSLNWVILEKKERNVSVLVKVIALGNGGVKSIWQISFRILLMEAFCFFCHYPLSGKNFTFALSHKTKEVSLKKSWKGN